MKGMYKLSRKWKEDRYVLKQDTVYEGRVSGQGIPVQSVIMG